METIDKWDIDELNQDTLDFELADETEPYLEITAQSKRPF